jgi:type IV pilus assembly protein PilM
MVNFSFFSKSSDNSSLGIDIGTSSLKVVELSGGKEITLENYGEVFMRDFLGQGPVKGAEGSLVYSSKEIAEAIKHLLSETGIKTKRAYFSIPDFVSFFTSFTVPPMKKEEINSSIEFHAKQYIPLPISEVALDWFLEEGDGKEKVKVNLIAVPNEIIDQYREIARLAQIEIISLEGEMFALVRALVRDVEKPTAIIDVGEQSTLLTIAEKGILKTTHSLEIAGNMLVKQVAKYAEIEYNSAREVVMSYGIEEEVVKKAVFSPLTSLFSEVSRVIDAFEKKEGSVIEEVIIAGGFSLLPGVVEFAEEALDKKAIRKSCFQGIVYPNILEEELARISNSHSIAFGVALNGIIKEEK